MTNWTLQHGQFALARGGIRAGPTPDLLGGCFPSRAPTVHQQGQPARAQDGGHHGPQARSEPVYDHQGAHEQTGVHDADDTQHGDQSYGAPGAIVIVEHPAH